MAGGVTSKKSKRKYKACSFCSEATRFTLRLSSVFVKVLIFSVTNSSPRIHFPDALVVISSAFVPEERSYMSQHLRQRPEPLYSASWILQSTCLSVSDDGTGKEL